MQYNIKAHETRYNCVLFRSRHEARWAAFFDLAGWKWEYEPIDINGWTPDFRVTFPCHHGECPGSHTLLAEVKPYFSIDDFKGHRCMDFPYGRNIHGSIPADSSAAFGASPDVVLFEMVHGAGGGVYEEFGGWVNGDIDALWKQAGEITRYRKDNR